MNALPILLLIFLKFNGLTNGITDITVDRIKIRTTQNIVGHPILY